MPQEKHLNHINYPRRGVKLRQDSRNLHYHKTFGATVVFPTEKEFDVLKTDFMQDTGAVDCTAFSNSDVCTDQTTVIYDRHELWSHTPHNAYGATMQDALGALVQNGLLSIDTKERDTRWKSYYQCDMNSEQDYFDSVRSTMMISRSSVTLATNWYSNWVIPQDGVFPMPDVVVSGHAYKACGWRQVNGQDQMKVKTWQGGFRWMPRDVFNKTLHAYGTGAYLPTTTELLQKVKISFLQKMLDKMVNILLAMKQWISYYKH